MVVSNSFDTHGTIGPWIVTTDEIGDPLDITLKTFLNGDLRQDGHTGDMLFNVVYLWLEGAATKRPGVVA